MIEFKSICDRTKDFTGICKYPLTRSGGHVICHYKSGKLHNDSGPSLIFPDGREFFFYEGVEFVFKEFEYVYLVPNNFTGICRTKNDGAIRHYKRGLMHRVDGPAIEYTDGSKDWIYEQDCFGTNDAYTNETWQEFVKTLKK